MKNSKIKYLGVGAITIAASLSSSVFIAQANPGQEENNANTTITIPSAPEIVKVVNAATGGEEINQEQLLQQAIDDVNAQISQVQGDVQEVQGEAEETVSRYTSPEFYTDLSQVDVPELAATPQIVVDDITGLTSSASNRISNSFSSASSSAVRSLGTTVKAHLDENSKQLGVNIANTALAWVGTPYVWGGNTPGSGLDCSGLTQQAYKANGINITRTTHTQINDGVRISVNDIAVGDLVFYNSTQHVALYIGDGKVVHAPQPGDVVKVDNLHMMPVQAVVRII